MSQILVTGAAGFVGSSLCRELCNDSSNRVVGLDRMSDYYSLEWKRENLRTLLAMDNFTFIEEDIQKANLTYIGDEFEIIYHQAGQAGVRPSWGSQFDLYVNDNIVATQRLLEAARGGSRLRRFVYASSSSVYGNATKTPTDELTTPAPVSPYGVTKLAAEHLVTLYGVNYGVPTTSLRYFTVMGPGQRPDMALTRICAAALSGTTFQVFGDGSQTRDFSFIDDVVNANVLAGNADTDAGSVFNIAGGGKTSLAQLINMVEATAGKRVPVEYVGKANGDALYTEADTSKARKILGWEPKTPMPTGISRQVSWARRMHELGLLSSPANPVNDVKANG